MENDGKESYKDGDQFEDLSVEYECSSDESDDMVDVTVDEAEADIINVDGFEKLITDLTIEDIWNWYLKTVDANDNINTRQLVCNKAGERHWKHFNRDNQQRKHRAITRLTAGRGFVSFVTIEWYRHLIAANRGLNEADKTQADSLRAFGVKTCHIIGYMVFQKGGDDKLSFTSKDLHNHISKTRRGKMKDGDAFVALAYLLSKADSDPLFLGKFTLKEGRLDNLVWADGESVIDYECFGDVLVFDTTYKKNVYNKPLVIFSGTNHHGQTTIFGCALLSDESSESFKWALKEFLEIMSGKLPGGVMTDGDHAMREAILEVFPGIPRRLCAWHLHRNARWSEIISKYGLAENEWIQSIYNDKMKWATAYLREHFFGRIRTTSQCEGIHSLLKNYVDSFEKQDAVLTTCLESFEKQAAELYTRNIFKLVKDEIEATGALNVTECPKSGDIVEYNTTNYREISGELLKLISKVQNKGDAQARLSPMSTLIGDPAVVKTCPLLVKGDSPAEYSNVEDEPMVEECDANKQTPSQNTKSRENTPVHNNNNFKTEEITRTQETLKDKTNTSGIDETEVPDTATTKITGLPQYPMHHYPVVLPYQPYGGVLPIPFHPVPNGMAYFNQYPSTNEPTKNN
ncbi:protein FAR1-RELATED SEQUENCE 5-like [Arachis stenosperma]|uniref:protein FAR1-RELATED SEQUENCE 5-like n=1 Tax=Arachis stenosperma TaxID=217475 RepID=UPI0025AD7DB8|nr:protein FAR1-RELATED SEQUENCE 5-like [Arachis stenosperma]